MGITLWKTYSQRLSNQLDADALPPSDFRFPHTLARPIRMHTKERRTIRPAATLIASYSTRVS